MATYHSDAQAILQHLKVLQDVEVWKSIANQRLGWSGKGFEQPTILWMQCDNPLVELVQTTHFGRGQRAIEEGKVIDQANEMAHP